MCVTAVEDVRVDLVAKSKVARKADEAINNKGNGVSGGNSGLHLSVAVLWAKLIEHSEHILVARVRKDKRGEDVEEFGR